jgi:hypothetical protein
MARVSFDLRDYIVVFENIVSNELCDEIIEEYNNDSNFIPSTVSDGYRIDIRNSSYLDMSNSFIIQQNQEKRKTIDGKLFDCAGEAIKKYSTKFGRVCIQGDSGYTLLRYQEGGFYSQHTDHFLQAPRIVSCSFTLNDDFESGEFGFFNRELVYRPPKGSALMFPSNFLYPHEVMPVTKGTRYSIITWFI